MISVFNGLDRDILALVKRSYLKYPARFAYLLYDIIYYPEFTEAYLNIAGNEIVGFVLIFHGLRCTAIHVVGTVDDPASYATPGNCLDLQVEAEPRVVNQLMAKLAREGRVEYGRYLTMVCTHGLLREFHISGNYVVRRLSLSDLREFIRLMDRQGVPINEAEASMRLISPHWHYYGAFLGGELVSMAGTYLKLPEVWIVGDVYTAPEHRNKGLAKAVTSAVTRDAIASGAMAILHVDEENQPAIRAYRRIGYVATQQFTRIHYTP